MKTTNLLKAFGTANISLIIVGLFFKALYITSSYLSLAEGKQTFATAVAVICGIMILFGLINGMLSFFVNFDFKSKGN